MAKNFFKSVTMSGKDFIENEMYKSSDYSAYLVEFTPDDMQTIIDVCNTHNRMSTPNTIDSYANQMSKDKWIEKSGDTITFDVFGRMGDGQHRLLSAIKAKKNLLSMVVVGCDENAFYVKDGGKMRSCKDILSIAGVGSDVGLEGKKAEEFVKFVATCVKTTMNIINGSASEHGNSATRVSAPTNADASTFYKDNKSIFNNTYMIHNKCKKLSGYRLFPKKKFFDAICNRAQMQGFTLEEITNYFEKLFGTNYGEIQPICELREYVTSVKNKNRLWNDTRICNAYMMSWNAYALGLDVKITDKTVEDKTVTFYTIDTRKKKTTTLDVVSASERTKQ